ncbi:hypothetical protein ES703_74566 [subsurface metagenome]
MTTIRSNRLGIQILLALLAVVGGLVSACTNQETDICSLPTADPTQAGCQQWLRYSDLPDLYPKTTPLTPEEAFDLIQNDTNLVIIDVRSPSEFDTGHIKNTINLDYISEGFQDQLYELDPAKTYLIYSQNEGYSANTANQLDGFITSEAVYFISGGLNNWLAQGLPITK